MTKITINISMAHPNRASAAPISLSLYAEGMWAYFALSCNLVDVGFVCNRYTGGG